MNNTDAASARGIDNDHSPTLIRRLTGYAKNLLRAALAAAYAKHAG